MDEIIHDLTPYGYAPVALEKDQEPITLNDTSYTTHEGEQVIFDDVVYGSDVIADIIVNSNDENVKAELIDRASEKIPANYIRTIANETPITRRIMLLKRKTISRDTKKIVKIIIDNPISMVVSPDDIADMSIRGDDPIDMTIKHDEVEIFVPKK